MRPARELAGLVRGGQISSRELVQCYLDRIGESNPGLNAVVTLDAERALASADRLDRQSADGAHLGPLHGLPITVKDAISTAGMRSTCGATELAEHVPTQDAEVVRRLQDAGAVVMGKTNVPRWCGDVQTFNDVFGTTNNPWDLERTPGGSSGGAGAAVAAGLAAFEIGTDIGGSIRIPAAFCGVFGHKPTYGIVPQAGCIDRLDGGSSYADINVLGPIARDPEDLLLVLSVIAGGEPADGGAWRLQLPPPRHEGLVDYRVAAWFEDGAFPLDRPVADALHAAVDRLADAGVQVEQARPPIVFDEAVQVYRSLVYAAASVHHPEAAGRELAGNHRDWLEADHRRRQLVSVWAEWFGTYDALLCPVMPVTAMRHDHAGAAGDRGVLINGTPWPHLYATAWTGLIGSVYLPSTVIPVGLASDGLPVGMQIVCARFGDRTSIHLAALLNEVIAGYTAPSSAPARDAAGDAVTTVAP